MHFLHELRRQGLINNWRRNVTKLTLNNCYGEYAVSVDADDLDVNELVRLFKSVMLAAEYYPESLEACFGQGAEG